MFRSKSMGIFRLSPNCHSSFFVFVKFTSTCILYIYEIYIARLDDLHCSSYKKVF